MGLAQHNYNVRERRLTEGDMLSATRTLGCCAQLVSIYLRIREIFTEIHGSSTLKEGNVTMELANTS
jgi:hypothetical protein